jgi:hypothetical protein
VYALVIGGSITLVLLVLSTVYKQDYIRNNNRHAGRTPDQPISRIEPEKVDEVQTESRFGQGERMAR